MFHGMWKGKVGSCQINIEQGIWDAGVTIGNCSLGIGDWGLRMRKIGGLCWTLSLGAQGADNFEGFWEF